MSGDPSDSDVTPRLRGRSNQLIVSEDAISSVTPFSPDGDRPSDPKVKELVNAIVEALKMDQAVQEKWREQIAFNVAAAKSRIAFGARMPKPGDMKRKAARLRTTLEKARVLSKEIEPMLSAVLFELTDRDYVQSYETYKALLEHAIRATTIIEKQTIVPPGAQARDLAKFEAKSIALELVGHFDSTENRTLVNEVASLLYELLTGHADRDVPERLGAYAPAGPKMRGPFHWVK
jgi:hypothetical protein